MISRLAVFAVSPSGCGGDCNEGGQVTIDELVTLVNVALGGTPVSRCPNGDRNGNGQITIDELIAAVSHALTGCPITPEQACLDSGGTLGSSLCCLSTGDFPDTCALGACGCAPDESRAVRVCDCGSDHCFNGSACVER